MIKRKRWQIWYQFTLSKGFEFETALERFKNEIKSQGFEIELGKVQQPHFVDKMIHLYKNLSLLIEIKQVI